MRDKDRFNFSQSMQDTSKKLVESEWWIENINQNILSNAQKIKEILENNPYLEWYTLEKLEELEKNILFHEWIIQSTKQLYIWKIHIAMQKLQSEK